MAVGPYGLKQTPKYTSEKFSQPYHQASEERDCSRPARAVELLRGRGSLTQWGFTPEDLKFSFIIVFSLARCLLPPRSDALHGFRDTCGPYCRMEKLAVMHCVWWLASCAASLCCPLWCFEQKSQAKNLNGFLGRCCQLRRMLTEWQHPAAMSHFIPNEGHVLWHILLQWPFLCYSGH